MGGSARGDNVETVRAAADIGQVVGDHVALKPSGRKLKGLCPFHDEKTPSFTVDPDKGFFYCFGCRTGGDVFKFYMLIEKAEFPDALRELARRFGVPLPRQTGPVTGEGARMSEMHRRAADFFARALSAPAGEPARRYLAARGLGDETIRKLRLGYAPDSWDALRNHLRRSGYKEEEIVKAGLAVERRQGSGCYDRFRGRLMFPIEQASGGVIAFGGRVLGDGEPKYLNSPETPIFQKGRHFYGLSWSKQAIRQQDLAILVEGYTDFAALWQAGVRHVVAVLGTGFTTEHAKLLGRHARRVVINFDADRAGREAADRAVAVLGDDGFDVRVLELPAGDDPDTFVRDRGAEAYLEQAAAAPSFIDYLVRRAAEGRSLARPEERARAVADVLPRLADIRNRVLRAAALARAAEILGVREEDLRAEFRRVAPALRRGDTPPPPRRRARPASEAERQLVQLVLGRPEVAAAFAEAAREEDLRDLACGPILAAALSQQRAGLPVTVDGLQGLLEEEDRGRMLDAVMADFPELSDGQWEDCWSVLRRGTLGKESERLQQEIVRCLEEGAETARVDELLQRKLEVRKQIEALS